MRQSFRSPVRLLVLAAACTPIWSQCPAIEFFSAKTAITTDLSHQSGIGVLKLHPGTFIAGRYQLFPPNKLQEIIPNYQRHLVNCFQKGAFGHDQSTATDYSAGAGSQLALAANLDKNDLFGVIWTGYGRNSVNVNLGKIPSRLVGSQFYNVVEHAAGGLFVDVNGDGFPDLVTVNAGSSSGTSPGSVSVLIGNGDGTFKPAVNYATGPNSLSVAPGDFNGDGKLDLVAANEAFQGQSSLSLLSGNGDGTFKTATTINLNALPIAVAAADINGDGKTDLVVLTLSTTGNGGGFSILLGNGDGTFKPEVDTLLSEAGRYVAVGDFNKDGLPDLAISHFNQNTVSIFLGTAGGAFGPEAEYLVSTNPGALVIDDINGDGNPDVVIADGTPGLLM